MKIKKFKKSFKKKSYKKRAMRRFKRSGISRINRGLPNRLLMKMKYCEYGTLT